MHDGTKMSQRCRFMGWLMVWTAVALSACAAAKPEAMADQTANNRVADRVESIQPLSMKADVLTASQFLETLQSSFERYSGKLDFAAIKRHFGVEFNPPSIADKSKATEPWVEIKPSSAMRVGGVDTMMLKQSTITLPIDRAMSSGRVASTENVIQQDLEIRLKANQLCINSAAVHDAFKTQIQAGVYKYGGASRIAAPSWSHGAPEAMQALQKNRGNGPWVNVITVHGAENSSSSLSIHFEHEFYACAQRVLLRARQ
jgi:hypothetical protein